MVVALVEMMAACGGLLRRNPSITMQYRQATTSGRNPKNFLFRSMEGGSNAAHCRKTLLCKVNRSRSSHKCFLQRECARQAEVTTLTEQSSQPLAKITARFIYFDDDRPVEYAAMPKDSPTVPVTAAGRFNMVALVANRGSLIEPSAKHALFQNDLNTLTMCLLMDKHFIGFRRTCKQTLGRPDSCGKNMRIF